MLKAAKVTLVEKLVEDLKGAKSLVLVNYTGLNVKAQQELKKRLNEVDGSMVVIKNTLLKRASEAAKLDPGMVDEEVLQGQTALVIARMDPVAPIQVLGKFAKEFASADGSPLPKFKVGMVDGSFQDEVSLNKLSTLPGRDVLLGQLLGSLMSSMYGLVTTLQSPMNQLVYTLDQKAKAQ
ncbi:MAG TPA: 50S ribosomal protein L10 [Patescibacteria group bacterium]|nr:50S ribosomal protein L10 [Patescibacteria group bacterium]